MKMLAMSAAAMLALLAGASPAAAQKADPNAVCLLAVTYYLSVAEEHLDELPEEMRSQVKYFRNALHFHTGVLSERYTLEQLGPVMTAAIADYRTMPKGDRNQHVVDCIQKESPVLTALADAARSVR